jgi:hypothetical protein
MSQQSSLTQSAHSVRQVLTAYTTPPRTIPNEALIRERSAQLQKTIRALQARLAKLKW